MELEVSLSCFQECATGLCSDPHASSQLIDWLTTWTPP